MKYTTKPAAAAKPASAKSLYDRARAALVEINATVLETAEEIAECTKDIASMEPGQVLSELRSWISDRYVAREWNTILTQHGF